MAEQLLPAQPPYEPENSSSHQINTETPESQSPTAERRDDDRKPSFQMIIGLGSSSDIIIPNKTNSQELEVKTSKPMKDDSTLVNSNSNPLIIPATAPPPSPRIVRQPDSVLQSSRSTNAGLNNSILKDRVRLINLQQQQLKQRLTWQARMGIYLYHFYEPFLLAVSFGLTS